MTYKMYWTGPILNQGRNEELTTILNKRSIADIRQIVAFQEMTKEAIWKPTIKKYHDIRLSF